MEIPPSSRARLERATHLLGMLSNQKSIDPVIATSTQRQESGDLVEQVDGVQPVPPYVPLLVGEILHNLRSSLDHLIYGLLPEGGETRRDRSEFPIFLREDEFEKNARRKYGGIGEVAEQIVRSSQPFMVPRPLAHPLWQLHDLNRIDKHRHLHLVQRSLIGAFPSQGGGVGAPSVTTGPVVPGRPIINWSQSPAGSLELVFQIVFSEEPAMEKPVQMTLGQIADEVASILAQFESANP